MKTALITGFETFGKYVVSPTKWLALAADGKAVAGYQIHSLVLPSTVLVPEGMEDPGTMLVNMAEHIRADVMICFGLSSEVHGFQLERLATNWIDCQKYLPTEENNRPVDASRPPKEAMWVDASHWDTAKMQALFDQANIPFDPHFSDDAGQYSCNALLYRVLRALQERQTTIPCIFAHTACTEEAVELMPDFDRTKKLLIKKEDTLRALEFILQGFVP